MTPEYREYELATSDYDPEWGASSGSAYFHACSACGALVRDPTVHTDFHARLGADERARIQAGMRAAMDLLGRDELNADEITAVINGDVIPDPMYHDYDGHNACTRCDQKAYNAGAEGPCPQHPARNMAALVDQVRHALNQPPLTRPCGGDRYCRVRRLPLVGQW